MQKRVWAKISFHRLHYCVYVNFAIKRIKENWNGIERWKRSVTDEWSWLNMHMVERIHTHARSHRMTGAHLHVSISNGIVGCRHRHKHTKFHPQNNVIKSNKKETNERTKKKKRQKREIEITCSERTKAMRDECEMRFAFAQQRTHVTYYIFSLHFCCGKMRHVPENFKPLFTQNNCNNSMRWCQMVFHFFAYVCEVCTRERLRVSTSTLQFSYDEKLSSVDEIVTCCGCVVSNNKWANGLKWRNLNFEPSELYMYVRSEVSLSLCDNENTVKVVSTNTMGNCDSKMKRKYFFLRLFFLNPDRSRQTSREPEKNKKWNQTKKKIYRKFEFHFVFQYVEWARNRKRRRRK